MTTPVVLVLDDVHALHNSECRAALSVLADHVPGGSRLALAGRDEPPLRVARLRAEGRITEIGPGDLSLTREEASALLRAAQVALGEDEVAELHRRTEGWPAGLYLAALCLREGGSPGGAAVSVRRGSPVRQRVPGVGVPGPDLPAAAGVPDPDRGAGADVRAAVRGGAGLARVRGGPGRTWPGRTCCWCRWTGGGSGTATTTCSATCSWRSWNAPEPGLIPVLRRRAAGWYLRNGMHEDALEYSMAAGDVDEAARLVQIALAAGRAAAPGTQPCSGGSAGWRTGAGSRDARCSPCRPRSSPR